MNISGTSAPSAARTGYSRKSGKNKSSGFAETLKKEAESAAKTDRLIMSQTGNSNTEKSAAEDMSMTEYQLYIQSKISKLTSGSNRGGGYTAVFISDEGFEAMKNDPEYEKWVLDLIKSGSYSNSYGRSGEKHYSAYFIGASKEETHSEHWSDIPTQTMTVEERRSMERRRLYALQKYRNAKLVRYRKALRENSIKKAEIEEEHIKGIFRDHIYEKKNICAAAHVSTLFLFRGI
ncbi:MAG: hypothetical protein K2N60_01965 [Oscillospiraceae bacterium]|nr:hypothetical protein [Oscillospiraceae bacterium]